MASTSTRRQVLLFLAAVLLPCGVVVALGLRLVRQERELAETRAAEERTHAVARVHDRLLGHLETIRLSEAAALVAGADTLESGRYSDPAVTLVARTTDTGLVLPWEASPRVRQGRRQLGDTDFARLVGEAERAELVARDLGAAERTLRVLVETSEHPVQRAYARLLLARVLAKADRTREAMREYATLLAVSSSVTDEHGVSLALYAALQLLEAGAERAAILERVETEAATHDWLSPVALYMVRELVGRLLESAGDGPERVRLAELAARVGDRLTLTEDALELERSAARMGLLAGTSLGARGPPGWVFFEPAGWLVSATPPRGEAPAFLVAVRTRELLALAGRETVDVVGLPEVVGEAAGGETLGPELVGLSVHFTPPPMASPDPWADQRRLIAATLVLVVTVTLFGAYLLWRDVRRELHTAAVRSQFVANVSHELKTPLAAIRLFAETLQLGRSLPPRKHAEYLDTIVGESERLTRLLNNVLDFSRIEQARKIYHPRPTRLADVVERALRALRYPLAQEGFQLEVRAGGDLPPVSVDPDALEQALLNLLSNAMKYSGASKEIALVIVAEDGHAVIRVQDRGIGIPAQERERIKEKFHRVPSSEDQGIPGTGLGLTLVEHMVRAHGGRLEIESELGRGSTFAIHLPLGGGP